MRNVALDIGARKIAFCEVAQGQVVQRRTVSSVALLEELLGPDTPPARVAFEACREAWHIHDKLTAWGKEPILVDTTRVKQIGIGTHGRKTDRVDCELIARALERDTIPRAHVLSKPSQELRMKLMLRRTLVESRAQLVVSARGIARGEGVALVRCATADFATKVRRAQLPPTIAVAIEALLAVLDRVNAELAKVDAELERRLEKTPIVKQLMSAPGVGSIVAAAYVSVIDDPKRFRNAHQVSAYLGLVPREDSSGDKRRLGAITKRGNPYLRSLLVQAGWAVMRQRNDPMKTWAAAIAKRRGKRVAVVAVARRLAGLLWAMWRDGTLYDANQTTSRPTAEGALHEAHRRSATN